MKRILIALAGGVLLGALATPYAKLPPPTAEERAAAEAKKEKEAAAKEKAAKDLAQAQDRAVANYKKNKASDRKNEASASGGATAQPKAPPDASSVGGNKPGANHADTIRPTKDLTRKEAQTEMPTPAQANDHSSTARETVPSDR